MFLQSFLEMNVILLSFHMKWQVVKDRCSAVIDPSFSTFRSNFRHPQVRTSTSCCFSVRCFSDLTANPIEQQVRSKLARKVGADPFLLFI